ncbi:MAG: hypothetical protein ACFWTM_03895 [Mitsuokella multacida]|jgi:hypothetical protein
MLISDNAQKLYDAIALLGEGKLTEWRLHRYTGFSHGTFIAARKELCRDGFLEIEYESRKPCYRLLRKAEVMPQKN